MVKIFRILFFVFFIAFIDSFAQNIQVTASTDTSDYLVGDYINFTVSAKYDEGIRISPPAITDKLGQLEVIKVLPVTFNKEENTQQFNYIIAGYDSARIVIPKIPITYFAGSSSEPKTIETNEVAVFIHTLTVNPNEEIKDVKQPLRIPLDWLFWLILILSILIISLIAYFLYKKFRKPKEEVRIIRKTPPLPIHVIALRSLDKLKDKKLWQQGKVKDYHSEITEIIRKYFEERYHFNSLEMTTAQSMNILNRVMDNQKMIDLTGKFLTNADMVKFAKFIPIPSVNEEMMNQAYEIVEKTHLEEEPMGAGNV